MISVITPTVRHAGLPLVAAALARQTFREFEWLVVSPAQPVGLAADHVWLPDPPKQEGDVWTLNKAMNAALRRAGGELIVSWQDYTAADPDALEQFWSHFRREPRTLVGGIGHKYADETWTVKVWQDPRERPSLSACYPCYFYDVEFNFCAVPRAAFAVVGGYDEWLDQFFGLDGYSVLDRLNLRRGWKFKIDQTIRSYSLVHDRPPGWDAQNAMRGPYVRRRRGYLQNAVLPYLQ